MKKSRPPLEEQILRASKEIVVKFIETGRVSPSGFPDTFRSIYRAVHETVAPLDESSEEGHKPN
jgi:predicted transcriptional regulator